MKLFLVLLGNSVQAVHTLQYAIDVDQFLKL
jgi:hypothetical protein